MNYKKIIIINNIIIIIMVGQVECLLPDNYENRYNLLHATKLTSECDWTSLGLWWGGASQSV